MIFSIFAKIKDGSQNPIPKINVFLHFTQKFKMAAKNGGKAIFVKCCQYTLQIPCGLKISSISNRFQDKYIFHKSRTVSKINVFFLRFTQKFKMAAQNGGKMIFVKSRQ